MRYRGTDHRVDRAACSVGGRPGQPHGRKKKQALHIQLFYYFGAYLGQLCRLHGLVLHEATRNEGAHFSSAISSILAQLLEVLHRDVVALAKGEGLKANTRMTTQFVTSRWQMADTTRLFSDNFIFYHIT